MEDDRKGSRFSDDYSYSDKDRRDDRRRRDRDRDHDRSRRRDRVRRSRSRSRERHGSGRHDRDRDPVEGRRRADQNQDGNFNYEDDSRRRYQEQESSNSSADRVESGSKQQDWRMKLTSIRDAHFNRNKQPPSLAQNQFTNDGSFLEMFKKKMAGESSDSSSSVMPNSLVLASSSIQYNSDISLPPLTTLPETSNPSTSATDEQDLDGVPMPLKKPIPVPVSVGRRRTVKPLKTGVVFKKAENSEEDEASQEKLDAWARYLQEVQKYKNDKCTEEDSTRPLVK